MATTRKSAGCAADADASAAPYCGLLHHYSVLTRILPLPECGCPTVVCKLELRHMAPSDVWSDDWASAQAGMTRSDGLMGAASGIALGIALGLVAWGMIAAAVWLVVH